MASSRGDLDLGKLLGGDVTHYRDVLAGRNPLPVRDPLPSEGDGIPAQYPRQLYIAQSEDEAGAWSAHQKPVSYTEIPHRDIDRFGDGLPDQASTTTALAVDPEICWDSCGYYRVLGVHWKATRRELLLAYVRRQGPRYPQLTYALKQLLRDGGAVRRRYDRLPFGEMFLEDKHVQQAMLRAAMKVAQRQGAQADDAAAAQEVLKEWGLSSHRKDEEPGPEETSLRIENAGDTTLASAAGDDDWMERWGWYGLGIWTVHPRAGEILARWQQLLVAVFADAGVTVRFSVGLGLIPSSGADHILHIGPNGSAIFFICTEHPNPSMAIDAVTGYLAHRQGTE